MHKRRDSIQEYLLKDDVQQRIKQAILHARSQATVTIAQAADLFGFSENQLRDWEQRDLLTPERPQHEKGIKGRRLYSASEFTKLAIIQELLKADYNPGEITSSVYQIWAALEHDKQPSFSVPIVDKQISSPEVSSPRDTLPIDRFVEETHNQLFDRFFTAHVLYLVLSLICEDVPDTVAGLVLPLHQPSSPQIKMPEDLRQLGESLIGWWDETRSFYTFLTRVPTFDVPSDYRVESLHTFREENHQEENRDIWIVIQRKAKQLNVSRDTVEAILRLLKPIYDDASNWWTLFGYGMRARLDPTSNFSSTTNPTDTILTGIANMIVRLGGKRRDKPSLSLWRFCCILLPENMNVPLPQQSLIVRAQSNDGPHRVGFTNVIPHESFIALSLRAFQGGHVIYRHNISNEDLTIGLREAEGNIYSALAVPIGGEDGTALGVLYVASDEADAFELKDQRLLRLIGRVVEELLKEYMVRQNVNRKLSSVITDPGNVDIAFKNFQSEPDFINHFEALLGTIQKDQPVAKRGENMLFDESGEQLKMEQDDVVSFIAVDVDNQSSIANKHGELLTRNLSRSVGLRIEGQLGATFRRQETWQLYHIYADRFYIMLKGIPLERARDEAEKLRHALRGSYKVDALHTSVNRPSLRDSLTEIPDVTVRLGVNTYTYTKLLDLLQGSTDMTTFDVCALVMRNLDEALKMGTIKKGPVGGGDIVYFWDDSTKQYVALSAPKSY